MKPIRCVAWLATWKQRVTAKLPSMSPPSPFWQLSNDRRILSVRPAADDPIIRSTSASIFAKSAGSRRNNVRWFGSKPFAIICQSIPRAAVPTGEICGWCSEPINPEDAGFILPYLSREAVSLLPWHDDCHIRALVGGSNHQLRRCGCFGGDVPSDPPSLTKREAARSARITWERLRAAQAATEPPASGRAG
jgi:hypothetical protein